VGAAVTVLGTSLTGATSVSFNGTTAMVKRFVKLIIQVHPVGHQHDLVVFDAPL
jgi:hypothetical protein